MSTSSPVRVAVVGAGAMGALHARVVATSEAARLARVVDPGEGRGRALAARYGATWTPSLDTVDGIDAVIVAAATEAHYQLAARVIEAGRPLLVEKPLCDRLADSRDLVERARVAGVPLMCGLLERFNPAILTTMALLDEPLHVVAQRHSPYVARIRTGVASDLLIHDLDLVLRMMGAAPTSVLGSLGYLHPESEPGAEDVAEALLGFPSGALASVSASRISQRKVRSFLVHEVDRLVEVDLLRNAVTIHHHVHNDLGEDGRSYRQQSVLEIPALVTTREPLGAQLDRFVQLACGHGDLDAERDAILPPHEVLEAVRYDGGARMATSAPIVIPALP